MRGYKLVLLPLFFISSLLGQGKFHFEFGMDSLIMNVGESKEVTIKLLNENGKLAQNSFYVFGQRKTLSVSPRISDSTGIATVTLKAMKMESLRKIHFTFLAKEKHYQFPLVLVILLALQL